MSKKQETKRPLATMAELLKEKPKRGRPRHAVSRQNVYVALSAAEKQTITTVAKQLPDGLKRADLPDLAIMVLATRMEALRRAVADRDREIPEGITDLESLYLLWDADLPVKTAVFKWTSIRVSPQQLIELGRVGGVLKAAFSATRSETFSLALSLLTAFISTRTMDENDGTLSAMRKKIQAVYL